MTYPPITIAAFALLGSSIESPHEVAHILNHNLPIVGGGLTREFTAENVQRIMAFFQQDQPEFFQYALGFDQDANVSQTREFLMKGGLGQIAELPGVNPNQTLNYDALMVATNAVIRAAGGETRPLPRNGSFERTRETAGSGDMDAQGPGGQGLDLDAVYGQGGYSQLGYGNGGDGRGGYPGRRGGGRPPGYPRDPYGGADLGQWSQW